MGGPDLGDPWPGRAGLWELEMGPATISLGQGLLAREAEIGSWTLGRVEGVQGVGSYRKGWQRTQDPHN